MFFSLSAEQISWVRRWLIHTSPILLLFSLWPGHYTGKSQAALHPLPLTRLEPCIDSLANQEVLRWQLSMLNELGDNITHEDIKEYLWKTLKSGQVVPGLVTNVFPRKYSQQYSAMGTVFCASPIRGSLRSRNSAIFGQTCSRALRFNL